MQWFYIRDGQRIGPVEDEELSRLARAGQLTAGNLVWNPTLGQEWKPASSFPTLFAPPAAAPAGAPGATHNRDLMRRARESLRGQWALAVGATLLYQVVTGGIQMVPYLGLLVILILTGPLLAGWYFFFLKMARRESPDVGRLFEGFKMFGKALGAYALIALYISLWALLLILPGILAAIAIPLIDQTPGSAVLFAPLLSLLCLLAVFPIIRASLAYSQTFYILADHPDIKPTEAVARSKQMMDGFKWKLFCLGWRFFGWMLLAIFTCGIGLLWLQPYMAVATAHFHDDIRNGA